MPGLAHWGGASSAGGRKEFDEIAGRIFEQDLWATGSGDDVVAEPQSGGAEPGHLGGEVVDHQLDAIPAAGGGLATVRHWSPCRASLSAEQQPKIATPDIGEGGRCAGKDREPEVGGVKSDSRVDILDHIADVNRGHYTFTSRKDPILRFVGSNAPLSHLLDVGLQPR